MKMYNFGTEEQHRKPQGEVQYEVFKTGTAEPIVSTTDDVAKIPDGLGEPGDFAEMPPAGASLRQVRILYGSKSRTKT